MTKLELNALFIQPTRWCGQNCKNCYVKAHKNTPQTDLDEHVKLFKLFYKNVGVRTNQITISLDTLPTDHATRRHSMISYFKEIYSFMNNVVERDPDRHYPQVHVTARNINVVKEYIKECKIDGLSKLTVVSLSEMDYFSDVRRNLKAVLYLNYNYMCPPDFSSINIEKEVNYLRAIGHVVDTIYMILHKSPVGKPRSELVKQRDRTRMRSDVLYMRTMLKELPERIRKKVIIDSCLNDVVRSVDTGYGCNCNVSRFQIWPDGSVSGCPYAISGNTGPASTATGMIQNIRKAKEYYDFEQRCHILETHNSLVRRPTDSRKRV